MWTNLGMSGKHAGTQCNVAHLCIGDSAFLHFMCYVLHIIECARNCTMKHKHRAASLLML